MKFQTWSKLKNRLEDILYNENHWDKKKESKE